MKRLRIHALSLLAALGTATTRPTWARAQGWGNVRVPIAAHLDAPERGLESGLHLDFLAVIPLGDDDPKSAFLHGRDRPRLAIGPSLALRTLDLDRLGFSAGLEVVALTPGSIAGGVGAELGVGKWMAETSNDQLSAHLALSFQLRAAGGSDDMVFADTLALFLAADRSLSANEWGFTVGLEIGSLLLLLLPFLPRWN
jgi:hypothetical protein